MSETKFTPGPWTATSYPDSLEASVLAPICGTEAIGEIAWIGENNFKTQAEANAHLIAAAPEMYEALEQCLERLEVIDPARLSNRIANAKAVLAKARGES